MKSLMKNVRSLNVEDLLKINGGYSGGSGGGGNPYNTSYGNSNSNGNSNSSGNSSGPSSGYSASSGGGTSSYSAASSGSYNYNNERVTIYSDGTGYSSSSGFFDGRHAYSGTSAPSTVSVSSHMGQLDFSSFDKHGTYNKEGNEILFSKNACAATSLLNEVSEIYTLENNGKIATEAELTAAMTKAVKDGAIVGEGIDAGYTNFINGANSMAKALGLEGTFYETSKENAKCYIIGVDKDNDGVANHFYSSLENNNFYDPWSKSVVSAADLAKQGKIVREVYMNYKK